MRSLLSVLAMVFFMATSQNVKADDFSIKAGVENLNIEVVPLQLEIDAEVLGLNLEVDGKRALILTGQAAEIVLDTAGYTLDLTGKSLIVTGNAVAHLLANPLSTVANTTENVIMATSYIAKAGLDLTIDAVEAGAKIVYKAPKYISKVAKTTVKALYKATKSPITFVTDTTVTTYKAGKYILGTGAKVFGSVLKFLGFGIFFN